MATEVLTRPLEKVKKRQLELDDADLEQEEATDLVSFDSLGPTRRGRKQERRVSGFYREIKSLQNIGQNAQVMEQVFSRMTQKDMMMAACASPMWMIVACRVFRRSLGSKPFLRLWKSERPNHYLWMNWELHFHEELLGGTEDDEMEADGMPLALPIPSIQAIISVGNRASYEQFVHDEAKLPFRQDYVFAICEESVITAPDHEYLDMSYNKWGSGNMVVESLFIPKSEHFTMKGFGLELSQESFAVDGVRFKVELYQEDVGDNQSLTALLLIKFTEMEPITQFVECFKNLYPGSDLLVGDAEEIGVNRLSVSEIPMAVGFAVYTGPGATAAVYTIDFMNPEADRILESMKRQVNSHQHSLCFMFAHDSRNVSYRQEEGEDLGDEDNWVDSFSPPQEPLIEAVLEKIHSWMKGTPIVGVKSLQPVVSKGQNSNVDNDTDPKSKQFTFGFLVISYNN